jgi:PAS domain S-box-containing protein
MSDTPDGETVREDERATVEGTEARRRLYEVMDDGSLSYAEKREWALTIGKEYLELENGHVERVAGDGTHEIVASVGGPPDLLPQGERLDASKTYCRRTLESEEPLALSNASADDDWETDPAYDEHGLECYLGAQITVDGSQFGTVCFVARTRRTVAFSEDERAFVELVARLLGQELETRSYEATIRDEERERQRLEQLRESLIEAAPDAIFVTDDETREIVEVNEAAAELTGYSKAKLVDRDVFDLCPPEDYDRVENLADVFVQMEGTHGTYPDGTPLRLQRADGSTAAVEISAGNVSIEGKQYNQLIVRNISARREREVELRLKDRAFDEVDVGITIADATEPDLSLEYVNDAFTEITGYEKSAAIGLNCRFLQGPKTKDARVQEIRDALASESSVRTQLLNYRADGTPFWNELTITPIADDEDEVTHFVGIQRDVTEQKRRERLIRVLNRVLRHNLRNDLNVISGYAGEVAAELGDEAPRELDRIVEKANDLSELGETAQLLETVAREDPSCRPIAVVPLVRNVAEALRDAHPDATVSVDVNVSTDRTVRATERLGDAIAELGENAIVHTDERHVAFHVDPSAGDREDGRVNDGVCLRVEDDGAGIPEQDRRVLAGGVESKLDHGSSLGVWLVSWVIDGFGGEIDVREREDGTTVAVQLRGASELDDAPEQS